MAVTAFVLVTAFLLWPRSTPECSTHGRAADYQAMPATIGTGVTCVR